MFKLNNLVSFRPAQYYPGKCDYVAYYVLDPSTQKLKRQRIKLNHIQNKTERRKYALLLVNTINQKLYNGWQPLADTAAASSVTIGEALSRFIADKEKDLRRDTMRAYRSYAAIYREWLTAAGLIENFVFALPDTALHDFLDARAGVSARTYNNYLSWLRTFYGWCIERKYCQNNAAANIHQKRTDTKLRTTINRDQRARIAAYFRQNLPGYNLAILLCYHLFIRPKEMCCLKLENIDFEAGLITIPANVAKNHNARVLAMPTDVANMIDRYKSLPKDCYLFGDGKTFTPARRTRPLLPARISETWLDMRKALKLPAEIQFYSLKDTGITDMLEAGVPAKYVKDLADHHSLDMTAKYTHKADAKRILDYAISFC